MDRGAGLTSNVDPDGEDIPRNRAAQSRAVDELGKRSRGNSKEEVGAAQEEATAAGAGLLA